MPGLAAQRPVRTTPVHDDVLMHLAVLPYVGTHVDTGLGVGRGVVVGLGVYFQIGFSNYLRKSKHNNQQQQSNDLPVQEFLQVE